MADRQIIRELQSKIDAIEHREVIKVTARRRPAVRTCRVCGCTDHRACIDDIGEPCYWIDVDLCSACRGKG